MRNSSVSFEKGISVDWKYCTYCKQYWLIHLSAGEVSKINNGKRSAMDGHRTSNCRSQKSSRRNSRVRSVYVWTVLKWSFLLSKCIAIWRQIGMLLIWCIIAIYLFSGSASENDTTPESSLALCDQWCIAIMKNLILWVKENCKSVRHVALMLVHHYYTNRDWTSMRQALFLSSASISTNGVVATGSGSARNSDTDITVVLPSAHRNEKVKCASAQRINSRFTKHVHLLMKRNAVLHPQNILSSVDAHPNVHQHTDCEFFFFFFVK